MPTSPDALTWLATYWPILGSLVTLIGLGVLTYRDVHELKIWVVNHRHDPETGHVYLPGTALSNGRRRH